MQAAERLGGVNQAEMGKYDKTAAMFRAEGKLWALREIRVVGLEKYARNNKVARTRVRSHPLRQMPSQQARNACKLHAVYVLVAEERSRRKRHDRR